MIHIPILRAGRTYRSLKTVTVPHIRTGEPFAVVSQANTGLIAKDLRDLPIHKQTLSQYSVEELIAMCNEAAHLFTTADLPLDTGTQSPVDYIKQVSGTTGLPETLCRDNMTKIQGMLENIGTVLDGLTRGLDLRILDSGWGIQNDRMLSYVCETDSLGAVLPSNSPGVHSLWIPAVPLKVPLVLKPGREEPWTPYRISQAFMEVGVPPEAFSFYPTDYPGANEILFRCGRSMLFGGGATVAPWLNDPRVEIHGPGRSKILIHGGKDENWHDYLDLMVESVSKNGGRSCINASGVWTTSHGRAIAEALSDRLSKIEPKPLDHPEAGIAAWANPKAAQGISSSIDQHLKQNGAIELTTGDRVTELDGCTFLRPTVIWCEDPEHPLANTEFPFPFVSVVEVPYTEIADSIDATLVATVITDDEILTQELIATPLVDRLNIGAIPTNRISWDSPHEGNLFEHLYRQRAFQRT
ncbi:aldehyde dehydrogenase family protein [Candidatus Poribacteria bacterium]|nr:aldehyde dehydrogenase family protein [Candidatus Poribacteria bacterium]MYB63402.1 aldehyde dehydrogenase family protein [Candidatus Poribacteria bacterium]MYF54962.1 aldehyde dehydrogenase family protein [Candidatus Poribacteria bacterium]MYI93425.1 aldehyde dehydrogenase family protein [Candidatus Poribacteria bacterium]